MSTACLESTNEAMDFIVSKRRISVFKDFLYTMRNFVTSLLEENAFDI